MGIVALLFLLCILHANGQHDYQTQRFETAPPGTFPFVVALRHLQDLNYEFLCSGSIIKTQWVLTAAHCVFNRNLAVNIGPKTVASIIAVAGIDKVSQIGSTRNVRRFYIHPGFFYTDDFHRNDLALLQLDKPFEISKTIQPIRLGFYTDEANHQALAIGYGEIHDGRRSLEEKNIDLRYLPLTTMKTNMCKSVHASIRRYPDEFNHICAYPEKGKNLCFGDAGGLLLDYYNWVQVGVFSGLEDCTGVYPVLYIDLKNYLPWIRNITQKVEAILY